MASKLSNETIIDIIHQVYLEDPGEAHHAYYALSLVPKLAPLAAHVYFLSGYWQWQRLAAKYAVSTYDPQTAAPTIRNLNLASLKVLTDSARRGLTKYGRNLRTLRVREQQYCTAIDVILELDNLRDLIVEDVQYPVSLLYQASQHPSIKTVALYLRSRDVCQTKHPAGMEIQSLETVKLYSIPVSIVNTLVSIISQARPQTLCIGGFGSDPPQNIVPPFLSNPQIRDQLVRLEIGGGKTLHDLYEDVDFDQAKDPLLANIPTVVIDPGNIHMAMWYLPKGAHGGGLLQFRNNPISLPFMFREACIKLKQAGSWAKYDLQAVTKRYPTSFNKDFLQYMYSS